MIPIRRMNLHLPAYARCLQTGKAAFTSENDLTVGPHFINRNPRNLEKLNFAQKPEGWDLDEIPTNYWHRVILDLTGRHTTGRIVHFHGNTVIVASTREWAIKKHLHSMTDVAASTNIGRVLARRCLQSGLHYATYFFTKQDKSEKVKAFLNALEEGGLCLEEPEVIPPETPFSMPRDCKPLWPTQDMTKEYNAKFSPLVYTRKFLPGTRK